MNDRSHDFWFELAEAVPSADIGSTEQLSYLGAQLREHFEDEGGEIRNDENTETIEELVLAIDDVCGHASGLEGAIPEVESRIRELVSQGIELPEPVAEGGE